LLVLPLFLKKYVNLLQEVLYPGGGLLTDQGIASKCIPISGINGLNSGMAHRGCFTLPFPFFFIP
jgi:hypothetical protein